MTPLHFQKRPATVEKMGQQRVPRQHLTGLQRGPIANSFRYRSVAVGGFLEDGTTVLQYFGSARPRLWGEYWRVGSVNVVDYCILYVDLMWLMWCDDRNGHLDAIACECIVIWLYWCPWCTFECSPIELTIDCRVARCFWLCFGPITIAKRAILPIKPSAIRWWVARSKKETSAPTCVTPKEIQASRHSSGSDQAEAINESRSDFGMSLVMDSQLEVTRIMVIVWKCGN